MSAEVFVHDNLSDYPDIEDLAEDFAAYANGDLQPDYFGRYGGYGYPLVCKQEEVQHIHLASSSQISLWSKIKDVPRRKSDIHLVYCRGYMDENKYLLISILSPDAHAQARNFDIMLGIGEIAAQFREQN